jgi:hypothetical protein
MKLAHALLALSAELTEDGRLSMLNGGLDRLAGPFPGPMMLPFFVAVKYLFTPEEVGKTYPSSVEIVAPDNKVVSSIEGPVGVQALPIPGQPYSFSGLARFYGIPFHVLGLYEVRINADNRCLDTLPLFIESASAEEP